MKVSQVSYCISSEDFSGISCSFSGSMSPAVVSVDPDIPADDTLMDVRNPQWCVKPHVQRIGCHDRKHSAIGSTLYFHSVLCDLQLIETHTIQRLGNPI